MLTIHQWSQHNQQLNSLNEKLEKCARNYLQLPFSQFCDTKTEFPCLRSNVSDPLNAEKNRPCIPYSKIGDNIEDCYNAYDEKNTFESTLGTMWGFFLRCGNFTTQYPYPCQPGTEKCAQIFCPSKHYNLSNCQKRTDAICINDSRCVPGGRCNRNPDCSYGEDEYWCAPENFGEQLTYRNLKLTVKDNHTIFNQQMYPPFQPGTESFPILPQPLLSSSWHYPIYFDFLPSFRLATILRFPTWFGNSSLDPCITHTCQPIFNQNNSYFCSCKSGFHGKDCSKYEVACHSYCSSYSLCRPDDRSRITGTNNPFCICPLGYFGPRCYLKFQQCDTHPCLNNGSCIYTNESYDGDSFVCICSKSFYGDRCQHEKMAIQVQLNTSAIVELPRASTIQFYDVNNITLGLILQHQQATRGFPFYIYYAHGLVTAPALGVLKTHYDSNQPQYFIIYIQANISLINITSSPENCPHASLLLDDFPKIPDVFKYHQICRNDSERLCFYDNDYLCICQYDNYRVDCFLHDTQIDHCTKCYSNGKCVKNDKDNSNDFICLCPRCYQGDMCEFNMQAFGFTLDSLLIDYSKEVKIIYLSIMFLLFLIGLFNNLCSFVTFKRPTPRKFGVGNDLFIITCLNQISLLCLLIKLSRITFGIINFQSCKLSLFFQLQLL